jgi:hypothetical protein
VRYEVRTEPLTIVLCHCTICQRRTGSAFSMSMPVVREGFVFVEGETIKRDLPGGSGSLNTQHFCEHCLVRVVTEPHVNRAVVYVRPGTLDETRWLQPRAQLWTDFGQPWACCEGIESFGEGAPDPRALIRAR